MLLNHLFLASLLPYLQADPPAGGGNPPEPPTPPPADPPLGENGEAALKAEREARKAADKRAKTAEDKLAGIEAAKAKADDAEAIKQGEWQTLAEKREADLTKATTDIETVNTELDVLRGYVTADVETITKAVKEAKDSPTAKALMDFYPGDDAGALALLAWAQKAKPRLPELAAKETGRGPGFSPTPSGPGKKDIPSAVPRSRMF